VRPTSRGPHQEAPGAHQRALISNQSTSRQLSDSDCFLFCFDLGGGEPCQYISLSPVAPTGSREGGRGAGTVKTAEAARKRGVASAARRNARGLKARGSLESQTESTRHPPGMRPQAFWRARPRGRWGPPGGAAAGGPRALRRAGGPLRSLGGRKCRACPAHGGCQLCASFEIPVRSESLVPLTDFEES